MLGRPVALVALVAAILLVALLAVLSRNPPSGGATGNVITSPDTAGDVGSGEEAFYLAFNIGAAPFNDPLVLAAFARAIDQSLIENVLDKRVVLASIDPATDTAIPFPPHNADLTTLGFDPALAAEALAASSYGGPDGLPELVLTTADSSVILFADLVGFMWSEHLDVDNTVEAVEVSAFILQLLDGDFQMFAGRKLIPPEGTPSTVLTQSTGLGEEKIEVASMDGFNVGDLITINPGGSNEETKQITAFGSFILDSPLQFGHEAGEPVWLGSSDTPTPSPTPTATGDQVVWGDANCSGSANPIDSLLTLRHDAGLSANTGDCPGFGQVVEVAFASPHPWGDVDCGGDITPVDSLKLLRFDAGLSVTQADGCPLIGPPVTIVVS